MTLHDLLPSAVAVDEGRIDDRQVALLSAEEELVRGAVAKRRRELTAGRTCARRALAVLGVGGVPILAGPRRQPLWPAGVAGSITHHDTYCAAAVAWTRDVLCIGIDAAANLALDDDLVPLICGDGERGWWTVARGRGIEPTALLFSIKESVFKAVFPLLGVELGFLDVHVSVDLDRQSLRVGMLRAGGGELQAVLDSLHGGFRWRGGDIVTAVWMLAGGLGATGGAVG